MDLFPPSPVGTISEVLNESEYFGGENSVHRPIFSLGVNKNISIILERFPWC